MDAHDFDGVDSRMLLKTLQGISQYRFPVDFYKLFRNFRTHPDARSSSKYDSYSHNLFQTTKPCPTGGPDKTLRGFSSKSLLLVKHQFDAAVELATFVSLVCGHGARFAKSLIGEAELVDSLFHEIVVDGLGAPFGEALVVLL